MDDVNNDKLHAMRHSTAHVLATAVTTTWPGTQLGVGPVVGEGFYYDVLLPDGQTIKEDDFERIEAEMAKIIQANQSFKQSNKGIDEAIKWAQDNSQPFKQELLNDLKRSGTTVAKDLDESEMGSIVDADGQVEEVGFYTNGEFTDLCRGPHVESTGKVGAFKLTKLAGAYWRGNQDNAQMQRIYGVAFENQTDLDEHLERQRLARERDHRKLGKEMELFMFSSDVGSGLPLIMPRGETLKNLLMRYMRQEELQRGYQYVSTGVLAHSNLYERSGHAKFYADDMYSTTEDEEGNKFYLKPMNCPHHHMIYEKMVISYRDLPLRLSEHAGLHRNELSGTLSGLIRVRGPITQNDSHTYVTADQLKQEFKEVMLFFEHVYRVFDFDDYWYRVSLPDFSKDKYEGDKPAWEYAANLIVEVLDEVGAKYTTEEGEAAFYGPKLDVQTTNVNGNEDSIATVQLDVLVPRRMELTYVDSNGAKQYPYVIHKSIMGAFERFIGFLLEKTGGELPFWLAPEQIRIVTVNDSTDDFVDKITSTISGMYLSMPLKFNELRWTHDNSKQSLGKKIHAAESLKIPLQIIVGPRDAKDGNMTVRFAGDEQTISLDELEAYITGLGRTEPDEDGDE